MDWLTDWLTDPFQRTFMREALVAGALTVVTMSVVGTWVVLRGLSFMGDALAHGLLPGIAVAFLWGIDITLGALAGAAVMVVGIDLVDRRTKLTNDTAIGLLFVGMLALGVAIVSRKNSFAGDLTGFLFGNILAVDRVDLWLQAMVMIVVLVGVMVFYRSFLVLSLNEDKAATLGLHPRLAHATMLSLIALSIVASFQVVGTLLVFGLLVAPPATASLLVRRVPAMMATGVVVGLLAVVGGLLISYHLGTAQAATMAGLAAGLFFVVLAGRASVHQLHRLRRPAGVPELSNAEGGATGS